MEELRESGDSDAALVPVATCVRQARARGAHPHVPVPTLVSAGGRNLSVRGCGTRDLCQEEGFPALPGHRLAGPPVCNARQRAILDPKCHSGAALGLRLALPVLTVALGTATLS